MSVHTCGVEDWDMDEEPHSSEVEVSIGYVKVTAEMEEKDLS